MSGPFITGYLRSNGLNSSSSTPKIHQERAEP